MFAIIVNPVSGGQNKDALLSRVTRMLEERGKAWQIFETQGEGDATNLTRKALDDGCKQVICMGGDGTLCEVISAIAQTEAVLYIVPCGTGNDFARTMNLYGDPAEMLVKQLDGVPMQIDCGWVNDRGFLNISGSGFDVAVLKKTEELKQKYPGGKAYRKAVLSVLESYRAFEAELTIDDGACIRTRATIVEIANGRFFGGGMCVAPDAKPNDGLFDVVVVRKVPRLLIPLLFPLFIFGLHTKLAIAQVVRAKRVLMRAPGMTLNVDGKLIKVDEASYTILPNAVHMMRPIKRKIF